MNDIRIEQQCRGVRIITGRDANLRRRIINLLAEECESQGFHEIVLPTIEPSEIYADKAGPEVLGQMWTFKDRGERDVCLRPEGTATCQLLARGPWKYEKDIKVWYEARCFRYERPQAGRYREFTQFGVEWLNPRDAEGAYKEAVTIAQSCVARALEIGGTELNRSATRGLAYYQGEGFEISCPRLGAQKQICGGGRYAEGCGFAFGVDRLMMAVDGGCNSVG